MLELKPSAHAASACRRGALMALCLLLPACSEQRSATVDPTLIYTVQRSDLEIRVREQGEIQAANVTRVASELEGEATLIYLIPEGSVVEQGEKLAELDVSELEERRASQAINVARAEASLEQARKNFEVLETNIEAEEQTAVGRLRIARIREEKFTGQPVAAGSDVGQSVGINREMVARLRDLVANDLPEQLNTDNAGELVDKVVDLLGPENLDREMGELANQVLQQIDELSLARADLELAEDTLEHSRVLAQRDFITSNELERDTITYRRQLSRVTLAWNNLQLLINYTLPENRISLKIEVENARLGLDSVRASSDAQRVGGESDLRSAELEYDLAKERLDNLDRQIANSVILAPNPGLVVYSYDHRRRRRTEEGMEVREGQQLIFLPDVRTMIANLKVHEAQVDKVAPGQRATVKVDAFPGRSYSGRVSSVSSLPDSKSRWSNQDLKVYVTTVLLDLDNSDGTLRPGMNSTVEIQVGTLESVLNIPLPALKRSGDQHYAWRDTAEGPIATKVRVGANNLTHIEIVDGLREGDEIYLVPPPGMKLPSPEKGALPPTSDATPSPDEEPDLDDGAGDDGERGGRRGPKVEGGEPPPETPAGGQPSRG